MSFPASFDTSLIPADEKVMAAVSSGADSLALLWLLQNAGCGVVVGHVNHGLKLLRGDECDEDEAFVVAHCRKLGVPVVSRRIEVPHHDGHAAEEPARALRYAALAKMAREHGCSRVATGHTASDVLETVLLLWLRGATVQGFAGIPPQRELAPGVLLVRPMLSLTREDARNVCRRAGWEWREDASNRDPDFTRNRIRHALLPQLLEAGNLNYEQLAHQTARSAALWRDDLDYLDAAARAALEQLRRPTRERAGQSTLALDGDGFCALHPALQRRVLRVAVELLQGETRDLPARQVEEVRRYACGGGRRKVWTWRRGIFVEWTGAMAGNRLRLWHVVNLPAQ